MSSILKGPAIGYMVIVLLAEIIDFSSLELIEYIFPGL